MGEKKPIHICGITRQSVSDLLERERFRSAALSRVRAEELLGNRGDSWPQGDAVRPEAHFPNTFF